MKRWSDQMRRFRETILDFSVAKRYNEKFQPVYRILPIFKAEIHVSGHE